MNLGLVFKSGDAVLIGVFLCLIAMSITTWVLILLRGVRYRAARRANRAATEAIWEAKDLVQAEQQAKQIDAPISELALDAIRANQQFQATQSSMLSASLPRKPEE